MTASSGRQANRGGREVLKIAAKHPDMPSVVRF